MCERDRQTENVCVCVVCLEVEKNTFAPAAAERNALNLSNTTIIAQSRRFCRNNICMKPACLLPALLPLPSPACVKQQLLSGMSPQTSHSRRQAYRVQHNHGHYSGTMWPKTGGLWLKQTIFFFLVRFSPMRNKEFKEVAGGKKTEHCSNS